MNEELSKYGAHKRTKQIGKYRKRRQEHCGAMTMRRIEENAGWWGKEACMWKRGE